MQTGWFVLLIIGFIGFLYFSLRAGKKNIWDWIFLFYPLIAFSLVVVPCSMGSFIGMSFRALVSPFRELSIVVFFFSFVLSPILAVVSFFMVLRLQKQNMLHKARNWALIPIVGFVVNAVAFWVVFSFGL